MAYERTSNARVFCFVFHQQLDRVNEALSGKCSALLNKKVLFSSMIMQKNNRQNKPKIRSTGWELLPNPPFFFYMPFTFRTWAITALPNFLIFRNSQYICLFTLSLNLISTNSLQNLVMLVIQLFQLSLNISCECPILLSLFFHYVLEKFQLFLIRNICPFCYNSP